MYFIFDIFLHSYMGFFEIKCYDLPITRTYVRISVRYTISLDSAFKALGFLIFTYPVVLLEVIGILNCQSLVAVTLVVAAGPACSSSTIQSLVAVTLVVAAGPAWSSSTLEPPGTNIKEKLEKIWYYYQFYLTSQVLMQRL